MNYAFEALEDFFFFLEDIVSILNVLAYVLSFTHFKAYFFVS